MDQETLGRWIFAIGKHLVAFQQNAVLAQLYATRQAARHGDLLVRLRQLERISATKFLSLAADAGLAPQEIAFPALEGTGLVTVAGTSASLQHVNESIFTEQALFRGVALLFEHWHPQMVERALVHLTELLSGLPLRNDEIVARLVAQGFNESTIGKALEIAHAVHLVNRLHVGDFGGDLYYNEYLWGHKIEKIAPILAGLGRRETEGLLAIMEEIRQAQGTALERLTAAPAHVVKLAASTGIVDTLTIRTLSGREKTFAFSPQFYGFQAGPASPLLIDTADQVKLMVASMEYGLRYSEDFRLRNPIAFLDKLLHTGSAGDATPIGRDYVLLEKQGIVSTERTYGSKARFVLVKADIIQAARDVMAQTGAFGIATVSDARSLVQQSAFHTPERNRMTADFALEGPRSEVVESEMLAAVREQMQKGQW
jgi:hypothetical protein